MPPKCDLLPTRSSRPVNRRHVGVIDLVEDAVRLILAATVICALGVSGCGGNSPSGPSGPSGSFNLMLKDTPFQDAKSVLVTFSEVTAHRDSDVDFTPVPFAAGATTRTCDLKKLETAQDVLRNHRIHRAYWVFLAVMLPLSIPVYALWDTPWWHAMAPRIMGVG
jgi:hypothetical protein